MTSALDTIRYHSGIAGEEVADMVDSLEREVFTLREQVEKLEALVVMRCDLEVPPQFSQGLQPHEVLEPVTAEHCQWFVAEIEKLTKERDELHRAFNQPVPRSEWEKMQEQLAALAEQNEKMRKVLLRLACLGNGDQYGNSIGNCIAQEALSLPDLATPVLNKIKAEAYREAAMHCSKHGSRTADEVSEDLFANADELEQSK